MFHPEQRRSSFDMRMLPKRIINTNTSSCLKQFNNRTVNVCDVFLSFSANEWSDRLDDYFDFDVRNFDGTEDPVFVRVKDVQKYFLPVLCILGIFGNIVSMRVFWTKSMRRKSCIVYLIIKCVMDTFFLVSLFIFWLDRVGVSWFQHTLACQTIVFVTYLSSYLSAWMVVMVTIENYIHVRHSQRAKTLCTPFKAKMISLGFILLGLACYHFSFWTTTSEASGNRHVCTTKLEYFALHEIFTYVDTTLTLALPSLLLFVFTTGIVCCLLVLVKGSECRESCKRGPTGTFQISPLTQITVMLLAVTFSFILFHTPSHVVRLWMICEAFLTTDPNQLLPALRLQRVFEILYYTNFATNFLTFFFTGRQYRRVLKLRLMRFLCRKSSVTSAAYL